MHFTAYFATFSHMKNQKLGKIGKIIPNGVSLEKHEYNTILFFTTLGYNIELIPKSNINGIHTPDIKMSGIKWEIKSPKGEGKSLMKNTIQKALKQSNNIIIDLRRTKRHQTKCLRELERQFNKSNKIKRMKVITKNEELLDFNKR